MIPRTVAYLFEHGVALEMSMLEIYREKVHDLLAPDPWATDLPLRESADRHIVIPGLTRQTIASMSEFERWFAGGVAQRSTASTALNAQSSRSHSCVILHLLKNGIRSKLHLIDLAGSEDNRRTANTGDRLIESGSINRSLFVLSQVVEALNQPNALRIPYRDSKLTRLLQDSLGGSCQALMIANVAPTESMLWDTYCTLNFAAKSRLIENVLVRQQEREAAKEAEVLAKERRLKVEEEGERRKKLEHWKLKEKEGKKEEHKLSGDKENASPIRASKKRPPVILSPPTETSVKSRRHDLSTPQTPIHGSRPEAEGRTAQIERQIDVKVAERLQQLTKGTTLSPLLRASSATLLVSEVNGRLAGERRTRQQECILIEGCERLLKGEKDLEASLLCILNHGPVKLLRELPECGPKRAQVIIDSRETAGPFTQLMELVHRELVSLKILWRIGSEMAINRSLLTLLKDKAK